MTKTHIMSFFLPPISPVKDADGRVAARATLTPYKDIPLKEVHRLITSSERLKQLTEAVRRAAEADTAQGRILKQHTLPYVTPCDAFSYRSGDLPPALGY